MEGHVRRVRMCDDGRKVCRSSGGLRPGVEQWLGLLLLTDVRRGLMGSTRGKRKREESLSFGVARAGRHGVNEREWTCVQAFAGLEEALSWSLSSGGGTCACSSQPLLHKQRAPSCRSSGPYFGPTPHSFPTQPPPHRQRQHQRKQQNNGGNQVRRHHHCHGR